MTFDDRVGVTRDVSTTGVCFYVDGRPPDVGSTIHLRIDVPARLWEQESALRFEVEVVRVEEEDAPRPAVAGRFLDWRLDPG